MARTRDCRTAFGGTAVALTAMTFQSVTASARACDGGWITSADASNAGATGNRGRSRAANRSMDHPPKPTRVGPDDRSRPFNQSNAFVISLSMQNCYQSGMNFRHLRAFATIVDAGGFARAAARLHLSQPALSR